METGREEVPTDGEAGALVHRLPEQCCQLLPRVAYPLSLDPDPAFLAEYTDRDPD
jgi:hypothetical protein